MDSFLNIYFLIGIIKQHINISSSGNFHSPSPCVMALILSKDPNSVMNLSEQLWAEQLHTYMQSSPASDMFDRHIK